VSQEFAIAGRPIGMGHPVYVVAELSGNHNGDLGRALRLIDAAADSGADAVKLQTYTADTITLDSDAPPFRIGGGTLWDGRTLHDLYREAATPWEWHPQLLAHAAERGLHCFSSPFDSTAVDYLASLGAPAYKVASLELVDIPLLRKIAATGKPVVVSTGAATIGEVAEGVVALRDAGAAEVALLKCTSAYPALPEEMNLRTIPHMREAFGVPVGLSDHTSGTAVAVAAVVLGACIVEKHLTLRRADGGPDAAFSLEPEELRRLVEDVRTAASALGRVCYEVTAHEAPSRRYRRSLFVVADVAGGEAFTERNVRSIRPGDGLHPRHLPDVLGRLARCSVARGTPLSWEHID
jgi:pseudaminic acid synthase